MTNVPLDELEIMVQLIKADRGDTLSYKELAEEISKTFAVEVNERDIFVLYEPSIQNDVVDSQIYLQQIYGNMGCGYLDLPNRNK